MNKTLWQVLITGALAEVVMFCALIFRHTLTLGNVARGYLYIFALMFFYLSVLRMSRSYNAAFILSLIAAAVPVFGFIYDPFLSPYLASALFCAMSFFVYTFTDATGLKYNQDKHFLLLSLFLYIAALAFSLYASALPLAVFVYEKLNNKNAAIKTIRKKVYFYFLITFIAVIIKLFGF